MSDLGDALNAAKVEPEELREAVRAAIGGNASTGPLSDEDLARIAAKNRIQQIVGIPDEQWIGLSDSQREYFCNVLTDQMAILTKRLKEGAA